MSVGNVRVYYATDGVPRRIEQVCGRALEASRTRSVATVSAKAAARAYWGILGN